MKQKDSISLGDIYGKMLNSVKTIKESKESKTFEGEFRNKKQKDGPEVADGYNKAENEPEEDEEDDVSKYLPKRQKTSKKLEDKLKDPNISDKSKKDIERQLKSRQGEESEEDEDRDDDYSEENWENKFRKEKSSKWSNEDIDETIDDERKKKHGDSDEDEEILESKKIANKMLNKHMSKSAFDKLFNKVLKENFGQPDQGDDLDALGLDDSTSDSDMGEDFGDDEDFGGDEDSVSFTLDRATAQTLIDVLQGALGGEDEGEGEDDLDFGDEDEFGGEEDDGMDFEEDEEEQGTKPAPDKKAAFQAKSNKVGGRANPKGGHTAKTDVTDDTKTTNTAPPITALQGKSNQVPGSTLKAKQDYFR
jgi:hypothetical protein